MAGDGQRIPESRRETVTRYGETDSADGTGIGLFIVGQVADAHGWEVTVTDAAGGGARFEFAGVAIDR